jgi:superfamily II DNA/RNA helicase
MKSVSQQVCYVKGLNEEECFQVLCLSPTYELAVQTGEVAAKMAQFCPEIKIRFAVRGEESKLINLTVMTVFHILSLSSFLTYLPVLCCKSRVI